MTVIKRRRQTGPLLFVLCLASASTCHAFVAPQRNTNNIQRSTLAVLSSSREKENDFSLTDLEEAPPNNPFGDELEPPSASDPSPSFWNALQTSGKRFKLPPLQVDDPNLLFYDVFLLLNLVVSISFWVVHRMQLEYIALAFNEGCLLSMLWIVAGLYHGAFLDSAPDGHQNTGPSLDIARDNQPKQQEQPPWWEVLSKSNTQGGPSAAGLLALNTFINTINLRLIVALVVAVAEHRPVFDDPLEQLIPMEVGFGLILMCAWRTIHSAYTPRI